MYRRSETAQTWMANPSEGLTLDPNDPIHKLIVNIPDFHKNPTGPVARNALVSKLKLSTPG